MSIISLPDFGGQKTAHFSFVLLKRSFENLFLKAKALEDTPKSPAGQRGRRGSAVYPVASEASFTGPLGSPPPTAGSDTAFLVLCLLDDFESHKDPDRKVNLTS
jgi:hypothetical protein